MASRPKLQKLRRLIEDHGGEPFVFEFVADGLSMKATAEAIGEVIGMEFSRGLLYQWLDIPDHKERRRRLLKEARADSAERLAEDAGEILDDLQDKETLSSADVQLGAQRSKHRQWLAGIRNKDFSPKSGVEVNISVGELHLEALRAHSAQSLPGGDRKEITAPEEDEVVEAEFEVVREDEDDLNEIGDLL